MESYVFCLIPEEEVNSKIINLKNKIKESVGNQLYLSDPPHLTLYLGNFHNIFDEDWDNFVKYYLQEGLSPFEVLSLRVFEKDPITEKQSPIYPISKNEDLFKFQMKLVELLKNKKSDKNLQRYSTLEDRGLLGENLKKYGYPFVGGIWIPHFGIASFGDKSISKAMEEISKTVISGTHKFSYFVVYELNETSEELREVKRYKLQ